MTTDESTQSTETTTDHQAETSSLRNRRSFLRKTAATGVLGMTGISLATESASAGKADEENRSSHNNSLTVHYWPKKNRRNCTYYYVRSTGDMDHMGSADGHDDNLNLPGKYWDGAGGNICQKHTDRYAFNGRLEYVDIGGVVVNVDFSNVSD